MSFNIIKKKEKGQNAIYASVKFVNNQSVKILT